MDSKIATQDSNLPQVFPLTQMEVKSDGTSVIKRVRPLNYALISFVKNILNEPDTINISDDELKGEWGYEFEIEENTFIAYINTDEESGIISLDIYSKDISIVGTEVELAAFFMQENNMSLALGQIQIIDEMLRFHAAIDVSGVASEDPNYSGPHLISPRLLSNMYFYGISSFSGLVSAYMEYVIQNT
jgi:hypothetical protein